mgnify:CR=1 FL=1|jgi:hypothetical protein
MLDGRLRAEEEKVSVFISYSHEDSDIVEKIAAYLVKENIHIWIDKWEINYGDSLIQKIQTAVTEASVLLIMLSKTSVQSEWCKKELTAGLLRELEEKRVVTIPVLLQDCEIPIFLREKYYADFRTDFDTSIRKLQDSLLKNVDVTLNRVQNDKYLIDWAIDNGLKDESFFLNIDSVSFSKDSEYSVLCTLEVIGNDVITELYKKSIQHNAEYILIDELLKSLLDMDSKNDFRIFLDNNKPKHYYFDLRDSRLHYEFKVHVYIRRLGINNGFDLLFDFGSIIRMVNEKREEILKK